LRALFLQTVTALWFYRWCPSGCS